MNTSNIYNNNLTEPDEGGASLASHIMGLKKVVAANRVNGAKSVTKTAKKTSGN